MNLKPTLSAGLDGSCSTENAYLSHSLGCTQKELDFFVVLEAARGTRQLSYMHIQEPGWLDCAWVDDGIPLRSLSTSTPAKLIATLLPG